ncbi:MAG: hypothetical protein EBZ49_03030 [Proteobacteria bacterium]|nr:hypothetical protein [Pseudomonadota bacterium]
MAEPKDYDLYSKARDWADAHYKTHSAYKSMAIQKKYKELYGAKYSGNPYVGKSQRNLEKWRNEKWVDVEDYLKGKITKCGSKSYDDNNDYVACRPLSQLEKMDYNSIRSKLLEKKKMKHDSIEWD